MTPADTARVLAKAAAYDQRTVGHSDVLAWHEVLADLELSDALAAVAAHYADNVDRIMPAHVRRGAKAIDRERRKAEREAREAREAVTASAVRALPSRFEDDVERTVRVQAGVSHARDLMAALKESLAKAKAARDADPRLAGFPAPEDGAA